MRPNAFSSFGARIRPHTLTQTLRLAFAILMLAVLNAHPVRAQDVPLPRLIRIVVPFSPGASNDLFGRALAQRLTAVLGVSVVVENKPGAGGVIGSESVARSESDGSVLLFSSNSFTTNAAMTAKLPYDMERSFVPVALMARSSMILVVGNDTPWRSVAEFVAAARNPKAAIAYGSSGMGGLNHITTELFHAMAGTSATHVPYKGINGAVVDLIAGNIQFLITTVASVGEQIRAGQIRALAVSSAQRSAFMPGLPTIGDTVPGYRAEGWWGVFAPGGAPGPIVEKLNAAIRNVAEQPDVVKLLARESAEPGRLDVEAFRNYYLEEIAKWRKLVQERKLNQN